jgi:prophage regulatory protein
MPERLIRLPEVEAAVGLRRSAIYARIKGQEFPSPVKLGRTTVFVESEVLAFIDAQIARSRNHGATP